MKVPSPFCEIIVPDRPDPECSVQIKPVAIKDEFYEYEQSKSWKRDVPDPARGVETKSTAIDHAAPLPAKIPQLTHLKLNYGQYFTNWKQGSSTLLNVVSLTLGHSPLLTDSEVMTMVDGMGALREIEIVGCKNLTDEGVRHLSRIDQLLVHKPNLETLVLSHCTGLTDQSLFYLSQGQTNLKHLDLGQCNKLTDNGLVHLLHLDRLEKLVLLDCDLLSDNGMIHIAKMANLRTFFAYPISDEGLAFLAEGRSKIDTLNLRCSSGYGITPRGAAHLSKMTHLRDLRLPKFSSVAEGGLAYLSGMASLQKLKVPMSWTTDDQLAYLADGGSKIRCLDLTSCYNITDEGFLHLSRLGNLEEMIIADCSLITDVGLINLASGRANITKLDVVGFDFATPAGQRALNLITRGLFPLGELTIQWDVICSKNKLDSVARHLPRLHTLNAPNKNLIGMVRKCGAFSGVQHI